jgi:hypothetical protein
MNDLNDKRRVIINKKIKKAQWSSFFNWAAGNNFNVLIIPLGNYSYFKNKNSGLFMKMAERNNMEIEAGGHDLSLFIPRRLFFFHSDMFRMDSGRRKLKIHFCPTNPKTIEYLKKQAAKLFTELQGLSAEPVLHIWPEHRKENIWCSCPACRAFSPGEQNLIAVNSIADALAKINPAARVSYLDLSENSPQGPDTEKNGQGITARSNAFALKSVPPCFDGIEAE